MKALRFSMTVLLTVLLFSCTDDEPEMVINSNTQKSLNGTVWQCTEIDSYSGNGHISTIIFTENTYTNVGYGYKTFNKLDLDEYSIEGLYTYKHPDIIMKGEKGETIAHDIVAHDNNMTLLSDGRDYYNGIHFYTKIDDDPEFKITTQYNLDGTVWVCNKTNGNNIYHCTMTFKKLTYSYVGYEIVSENESNFYGGGIYTYTHPDLVMKEGSATIITKVEGNEITLLDSETGDKFIYKKDN